MEGNNQGKKGNTAVVSETTVDTKLFKTCFNIQVLVPPQSTTKVYLLASLRELLTKSHNIVKDKPSILKLWLSNRRELPKISKMNNIFINIQ